MTFQATDEQMHWREVWLQALESGKWEQTTEILSRKTENGYAFCCLGVAAACVEGEPVAGTCLPLSTQRQLGLRVADPGCIRDGERTPVSRLNDAYELSFSEIAAILRPLLARRDYDGTNP